MAPAIKSGEKNRLLAALPWIIGALVTCAAGIMGFLRFLSCSNTNFDLAFYTRIVWGLAYGDRFNTLIGAHDLGLHLSPVLYLFVPFAFFLPIAHMLLASQAIVLGSCVPVLYRIAVRKIGSRAQGLAIALAWALFPAVLQIGSREFHPGTLALLPLVMAFDFIDRKKTLWGAVFLFVATLCREDVALVAAAAGILVFFQGGRSRMIGLMIIFGGIAYFLVYTLMIQPHFLPPTGSIDEHFGAFGHTTRDIIAYIAAHPGEVFLRLFSAKNFYFLAGLLFPLAFFPVLSPRWLLPATAPLLINLLSGFPDTTKVESHYATLIIPSLFLSAICGMEKIGGLIRRKYTSNPGAAKSVLASGALIIAVCSLYAHYIHGALPGSKRFEAGAYWWHRNNGILCWHTKEIKDKKELSVLAPYGALAHLADRRRIYSIDFIHPKPDAAILDISQRKWVKLDIDRWFEPWETEYEKLSGDYRYGVWKSNPPYEMLWKGKPGGKERLARISPARLPREVLPQDAEWKGQIKLEAIESYLRIRNEEWSGNYEKGVVVIIVFYWRALTGLPADLFVKCKLTGGGKMHTEHFRPTFGMRKTGTWKKGEIIRDEQIFVSPGGWPLKKITARVVFIDREGNRYPQGARMKKLVWPEWEAERDK